MHYDKSNNVKFINKEIVRSIKKLIISPQTPNAFIPKILRRSLNIKIIQIQTTYVCTHVPILKRNAIS